MKMCNPFVLQVQDLPERGEVGRSCVRNVRLPESFGVELYTIPAGSEVHLDLNLTSAQEGILVSGTVRATARGRCSRCLRDFSAQMSENMAELVFFPERVRELTAQGDTQAADFPVISEDTLDLEPLVRDALISAMPFTPVCEPDCRGMCSGCGQLWKDLPADHSHTLPDSRFAALDGLFLQMQAERESEGDQ